MNFAHENASIIRRQDLQGDVGGTIYDVPSYEQGEENCVASCFLMVSDFQNPPSENSGTIEERTRQIYNSLYGKSGILINPYRINIPSDSKEIIAFEETMKSMIDDGPFYGGYASQSSPGHLVVITGVIYARGFPTLVYSNNPWGYQNVQSFTDFCNSIPGDRTGYKLDGIYPNNLYQKVTEDVSNEN